MSDPFAYKRDAALLWIADEALVDEYDGSLDVSDSAAPLGEDCLGYYADIFAERSKPTLLAAPAGGGAAAPSGRLGRKGSRGSNKLTRKQWSRALRERRRSSTLGVHTAWPSAAVHGPRTRD